MHKSRILHTILFVVVYALADLFPFRMAGDTPAERMRNFWSTSKRWMTTGLNVFTLATLIIAALVIGGLVIGTTALIREYIESNPLALVVEINGGIGAAVKTISEEDEETIRNFTRSELSNNSTRETDSARVVYNISGWNDYDLWFWKKDGSQDTDFTQGRTVDLKDPVLSKLEITSRPVGADKLFTHEEAPEIVVTSLLLKQLGYEKPPRTLNVNYRGKAAPLKLRAVAKWIPSGDFLITERFYRRFRDKQWVWSPKHRHAYIGPVSESQSNAIFRKAVNYFRDQNVEAAIVERAGSAKWIRARLKNNSDWAQNYWKETFFPTISLYLDSPGWYEKLNVDFDDPLPPEEEAWSTINIGYTRASVYVNQLSDVPLVVESLKVKGFGVDDRIAQEVTFLQQVSSFGRRLFGWVISAVAIMAAVNIGLSFAQTIQQKQAQIGILRAYGARRAFIFSIYLSEATMLWLLAGAIGLLLAYPAGEGIGNHLMQVWERKGGAELATAGSVPQFFKATPRLLVSTLGGSLLVCWLATAWAALKAARINPAVAVRARE